MGQYFKVVNLTKKQVIKPLSFGSGSKLMEFSSDGMSIMQGLAILLADGNGRGGGDLRSENPIVGSWAGDSIVVAGDYADEGKFVENKDLNLYQESCEYDDISFKVIEALCDDSWWREQYYKQWMELGFSDFNEKTQEFKEKLFGKQ